MVVANAHVHWDPEFCDVKLIQTIMMINELEQVVESVSQLLSALAKSSVMPTPTMDDTMGRVRISSWHPNFNGSHFVLPPSEIHRMTGLGGKNRVNYDVFAQAPLHL